MSRGTLAAMGVVLLVVTAGCVGSFAPTDSANARTQRLDSDDKTISVSATGTAEAPPDQAVVQVAAVASGDDPDAVLERLAANASRMREALRELGIGDEQIRTAEFNLERAYREEDGERVPVGYRGVHAFEVTLSNVSRTGAVIDAAVSNGADRIDSVAFTLSAERRKEIRAEALRDAMENARVNAEVIAASANLTISGVRSAATGDLSFRPVRTEAALALAAGDAGTEIESGPVTVTAEVQVVYNATGT